MDAGAHKPSKPSSNVTNIVYRFAKACKLRSLALGVFSNENNLPNNKLEEGSELSVEEISQWGEQYNKIYPEPIQEYAVSDLLMLKLFDTISTLKLAYIQLQQAHFPYNPDNIQVADDLIVSELKTLFDIKKSYKSVTKLKSDSSLSGPLLLELIQDRATEFENLQSQIESKDAEILKLEQELQELEFNNVELNEKIIKQKSLEEEKIGFCKGLTVHMLVDAFDEASKAIHDFAKPLISLMKASKWDLNLAANSIEDSIIYSKRSHKKYAFEAYISRRMFFRFSIQCHNGEDITRYADPLYALIEYPKSNFAKFCRLKYLLVVHPKMEFSFFGNLDQRNLVIQGGHPRTLFYQVFVKMAKWVWLLKVIGASIDPEAEIFGVERGTEFSVDCMENVVEEDSYSHHYKSNLAEGEGRLVVGFMVMPGFKVGCSVIRSRVYLSRIPCSA
ncbi:Gravitropic in the light [Thalictrum thalictroides]|uniref:Gravitropic in the light n=1 Tax=Thalictrum thalictroides TaxID=46969 RepID=A0A7J6VAU2_THATH|nr:Gravitropic in the light [Thalictrum thalictroides]